MQRIKSKKQIKYLEKIARNQMARTSKFFRRNLHVNHIETEFKIIRVQNRNKFFYEVKGIKEFTPFVCYFLYHLDIESLTKWMLNIRDSDIIYTDSITNKIISINEPLKNYDKFFNVWISKKNTSSYLKLKIGDVVFTR